MSHELTVGVVLEERNGHEGLNADIEFWVKDDRLAQDHAHIIKFWITGSQVIAFEGFDDTLTDWSLRTACLADALRVTRAKFAEVGIHPTADSSFGWILSDYGDLHEETHDATAYVVNPGCPEHIRVLIGALQALTLLVERQWWNNNNE